MTTLISLSDHLIAYMFAGSKHLMQDINPLLMIVTVLSVNSQCEWPPRVSTYQKLFMY